MRTGLPSECRPAELARSLCHENFRLDLVALDDNWGGDPQLSASMMATGAFPLADTGIEDAVLLLTLPPGLYSAQATGVNGAGGPAIVEVYEVR